MLLREIFLSLANSKIKFFVKSVTDQVKSKSNFFYTDIERAFSFSFSQIWIITFDHFQIGAGMLKLKKMLNSPLTTHFSMAPLNPKPRFYLHGGPMDRQL